MLGIGEVSNLISTAVDKIFPDANIEAQAKADALKAELTQQFESVMGQLEINKTEAQHSSVFVSGWRPAVGWVCVAGFGYEFLFRQLLNGLLALAGVPPVFEVVNVDALEVLLYGLLGLGGIRTVEKIKGVARK